MENVSLTYILASVPVVLLLYSLLSPHSLRSIPTVGGPSAPLLSYLGALRYVKHARTIMAEGYSKYKGQIFKVPMLDRWLVVVAGKKLVDELQRMPDDKVSFLEGAGVLANTLYMFGHKVQKNPYHVSVVRHQLTRGISNVFADLHDEIVTAFDDHIPTDTNDWVAVHALPVMLNIVARASGRVFVGLPYCRNHEYTSLAIGFTVSVGKARAIMCYFPPFLKPLVAKCVTDIESCVKAGLKLLGPVIDERWKALDEFGDEWTDRPNDALQWLIEEAREQGDDRAHVVRLLLLINFAAIFTSSHSFTHALYHLAASPDLMSALREEIDPVIQEDGWSKASIMKMHKLDSFMRESQRLNGVNIISLMRKTLKDVTFSNGVTIPAGNVIVTPAIATHTDDENYPDANVFSPFRHLNSLDQASGIDSLKNQLVSTSNDYIAFGLGRHACPGRFFAANELKTMLAHVVVNYDVKLEHEGVRPPNVYVGLSVSPDPTAKVLFRKRTSSTTS